MSVTQQAILEALQAVVDPNTGRDFVSTKAIKNLTVSDGDVAFEVELGYPAKSQIPGFRNDLMAAAKSVAGVVNVSVSVNTKITAHAVQRGVALLPKVKNIVAVASGKGGVGKSTTAVNLALALAAEGASVGLLDADIYGPSIPMMMGIEGKPESQDGQTMEPMENYGVQVMSIGFLVPQDEAMIWRGPMATQALEQLLHTCTAMFSTMPRIGTPTFSNILMPFFASSSAMSWGVVTITAPVMGTRWESVSWMSPVPGGMSTIR